MYEQSAGVPMVISGPGVPKGRSVETGTSLIDLASTAIEVTGVDDCEYSQGLPGFSLRKLANSDDDIDRTILSEYHDGRSTTGTFMIRWKNWKYVHYVGHPPQLFNLKKDPDELADLVRMCPNDPSVTQILEEGERRLRKICDP